MASEDITVAALARILNEEVGRLRNETAAFRADVLAKLGVHGTVSLRIQCECETIKAAIGRLENEVATLSGRREQQIDHAALRQELEQVVAQFAALGDRIEQIEAQLAR